MEHTGPAPASAPVVNDLTVSDNATPPPSPLIPPVALVHAVGFDRNEMNLVPVGDFEQAFHCDSPKGYTRSHVTAGDPSCQQELVEIQGLSSDFQRFGDTWTTPMPLELPSSLTPGDLPLLDSSVSSKSPLLVRSSGAEMCISPGSNMAENCQVGMIPPWGPIDNISSRNAQF